jgi:CheY-like chemotaxis protein
VNKILIVDDDPDFVEATRLVLESAGYQVASAADGDEGLLKAREEKPDLVILDVIMKTVLDGLHMSQEMANDPEQHSVPMQRSFPPTSISISTALSPSRYRLTTY